MDNQVETMSLDERAREAVTSAMAYNNKNSMEVAIDVVKLLWEKHGQINILEGVLIEITQAIKSEGVLNEKWLLQTIESALHNSEVEAKSNIKSLCTCDDDTKRANYFLGNWCNECQTHII